MMVCNVHFQDKDFLTYNRTRLTFNAVPVDHRNPVDNGGYPVSFDSEKVLRGYGNNKGKSLENREVSNVKLNDSMPVVEEEREPSPLKILIPPHTQSYDFESLNLPSSHELHLQAENDRLHAMTNRLT